MPSEFLYLIFAAAAAAVVLGFLRAAQRTTKRQRLEPERLATTESPRRARSSRPRRRPPTGVKQSALLPGRHAGQ